MNKYVIDKNWVLFHRRLLGFLLLVVIIGSGCTGQSDPATLRIAVLPILDTLPMYVADEQGYFADENLTVEFVPVKSAIERDQVIQAGRADGTINEILSTIFFNREKIQLGIVRYARIPTPEYPQFYILASGQSGITSVEELRGQPIGISEGTIIEYSTERLLGTQGFEPEEINTVAVPSLSDRMALLNSGELIAANLPDPLAAFAVQNGAIVLIDDASHIEYGHSVISFRKEILDEEPDVIRRFLASIEKAVEDINENEHQFRHLLAEKNLVPKPLLESFTIPDFPSASVPPTSQWDDVMEWAIMKGYMETTLSYVDSIDDSYLPK